MLPAYSVLAGAINKARKVLCISVTSYPNREPEALEEHLLLKAAGDSWGRHTVTTYSFLSSWMCMLAQGPLHAVGFLLGQLPWISSGIRAWKAFFLSLSVDPWLTSGCLCLLTADFHLNVQFCEISHTHKSTCSDCWADWCIHSLLDGVRSCDFLSSRTLDGTIFLGSVRQG